MKTAIFTLFIVLLSSTGVYAQGDTSVVNLHVDGMYTDTCPTLLKSAVRKIEGVKHVEASLEGKSATIEFDGSMTSLETIQDVIKDQAGFSTALK